MTEVKIETVSFAGWDECIKASNGIIELVATKEVGPRIVSFGFVDDENELAIKKDQAGETGGEEWKLYGGHRLWHSPEEEPRTYMPDNESIKVEEKEDGFRLVQPTEEWTQIKKEIEVSMSPSDPTVKVAHRLINKGAWPIRLAPWSITVLDSGGAAILPMPQGDPEAFLPDRSIALWPYSEMDDSRLELGGDFIFLRQDTEAEGPFKIGANVEEGWTAYVNEGHAFIKKFPYEKRGEYPDRGCTAESYTDDFMLELETLGSLQKIDTEEYVEHVEKWSLIEVEGDTGEKSKQKIYEEITKKV